MEDRRFLEALSAELRCLFPEFFVKRGVAVMTVRELFDFITDPSINQDNLDQYLQKVRPLPPCLAAR